MKLVRTLLVALLVVAMAAVGCSVPLDSEAALIPDEELPEGLKSTTSTTTTVAEEVESVTVTYYLVFRPEAEPPILEAAPRTVPEGSLAEYLEPAFMLDFPTPEERERLVNPLANWTLISAGRDEDNAQRATVDIAPLDPDNPPGDAIKVETAAQLVYFFEGFGISELRLLINGEDQVLPTGGADTEPGDLLTTELYPLYDPGRILPTTTTSASTTTTTAPPSTTTSTTEAPAAGG